MCKKTFKKGFMKKILFVLTLIGTHAYSHEAHQHHALPAQAIKPLPGASIYQLKSQWQDQTGQPISLGSLRGKKVVIAMIYLTCKSACPILTADIKSISRSLTAQERKSVQLVLASIDPKRDTVPQLQSFFEKQKLDSNWTLLTGDENSVRELAGVLGVQYKREADGEFSHSNVITLLNEQGVVTTQVQGLGADASELTRALRLSSKP